MRASDGKRPCQEARAYYYDLLCSDGADVPPSVRGHVATCSFCREQMGRLREMLFALELHPDSSNASQDETIETLAEQFRLLDERVTCSEARPCLPQLAMTTPQIRIPTPVTVHVDQCPQCAKDLAALRKLRLTADQLRRLSQLFSSRNEEGFLPAPVREESLTGAGSRSVEGAPLTCREVSGADVFDAVLPSGAPAGQRPKAVAAHIRACPVCRARAQNLHRTISAIIERADSDIETVYHAAEGTKDARTEPQDAYRYPVSVEIVHAGSDAACGPDDLRGILAGPLRRLRRPAASLARTAVIGIVIVALASFVRMTVPTASGTSVGQVRQAVEKAPNIHVVRTDCYGQLLEEFLVARCWNQMVHRTKRECVLYDLDHNLRQTLDPQGGIGAPTELSKSERDRIGQILANCLLGVLQRISQDTKLHPPADNTGREAGAGLDIYELPSSRQAENSPSRVRYLAYIDPVTGLPQKVEFCQREPSNPEWRLSSTTIYTYLTEQEMDSSIRALLAAN